MTSRTIRRLRDHIEDRLGAQSSVGENILTVLRKSEETLKNLFTPGMLEALKFKYVGPIPGHELDDLIATLENVRDNLARADAGARDHHQGQGLQAGRDQPASSTGSGPSTWPPARRSGAAAG